MGKFLSNSRGMTLIEILIVMTLIAGVMAIVVSTVNTNMKKAKSREVKIQLAELGKALDLYYNDCKQYPSDEQGLNALIVAPTSDPKCETWGPDPYIKRIPKDPWNRDFIYSQSGSSYKLKSYGADGKEGGSGYDKDISNEDL